MSDPNINDDLKDQLRKTLEAGLTDEAVKAFRKRVDEVIATIDDDITYRLKDDLAYNLTAYVSDMAVRTIDALLKGNESQIRRYLRCDEAGYTGRSTAAYGKRRIEEQHPIIHGKLHEGEFVALRRSIVEAHRDLIASERILDLEDQVKSLVAQVNKAEAARQEMWERVRALS